MSISVFGDDYKLRDLDLDSDFAGSPAEHFDSNKRKRKRGNMHVNVVHKRVLMTSRCATNPSRTG